jgi:DNA-binding PadR family transcriptional regulator
MITNEPDIGSLETEMNRGFLHILVLAVLEKDMYGYSMVKHIEAMGYKVEENTLYPLLRRLEKNGWIASKWDLSEDRPRKFYAITPEGRTLRAAMLDVWKTQNRVLDKITKETAHV